MCVSDRLVCEKKMKGRCAIVTCKSCVCVCDRLVCKNI